MSFGSRMAGAMLTAAKLPSLICQTFQEYQDRATLLAFDNDHCKQLREHLATVRATGALFDTPSFVRDFELRVQSLMQ